MPCHCYPKIWKVVDLYSSHVRSCYKTYNMDGKEFLCADFLFFFYVLKSGFCLIFGFVQPAAEVKSPCCALKRIFNGV